MSRPAAGGSGTSTLSWRVVTRWCSASASPVRSRAWPAMSAIVIRVDTRVSSNSRGPGQACTIAPISSPPLPRSGRAARAPSPSAAVEEALSGYARHEGLVVGDEHGHAGAGRVGEGERERPAADRRSAVARRPRRRDRGGCAAPPRRRSTRPTLVARGPDRARPLGDEVSSTSPTVRGRGELGRQLRELRGLPRRLVRGPGSVERVLAQLGEGAERVARRARRSRPRGPTRSTSVPATWPLRSSRGRQAVDTSPARAASATSSSGACSRQSSRVRSRTGSARADHLGDGPPRVERHLGRRDRRSPGARPPSGPRRSTPRSRSISPMLAALASEHRRRAAPGSRGRPRRRCRRRRGPGPRRRCDRSPGRTGGWPRRAPAPGGRRARDPPASRIAKAATASSRARSTSRPSWTCTVQVRPLTSTVRGDARRRAARRWRRGPRRRR